jgi:hypothetical protein
MGFNFRDVFSSSVGGLYAWGADQLAGGRGSGVVNDLMGGGSPWNDRPITESPTPGSIAWDENTFMPKDPSQLRSSAGVGIPTAQSALAYQQYAEGLVRQRQTRLMSDALGSLRMGEALTERYRPGSAIAQQTGLYQTRASLLQRQAEGLEAPDFLADLRREDNAKAERESKRSRNLQVGSTLAGLALQLIPGLGLGAKAAALAGSQLGPNMADQNLRLQQQGGMGSLPNTQDYQGPLPTTQQMGVQGQGQQQFGPQAAGQGFGATQQSRLEPMGGQQVTQGYTDPSMSGRSGGQKQLGGGARGQLGGGGGGGGGGAMSGGMGGGGDPGAAAIQSMASQLAMQAYAASFNPRVESALSDQVNIRLMRAAAGVA